ncbi:MAG TPA: hypothetical protein VEC11_11070 [Allosphingosinicella sp.]|nr:hypothetical protein [Allosphingosinicella sp.]
MSSGHITAIVIVSIIMFASVLRAALGGGRYGRRGRRDRGETLPARDDSETLRLREEVKVLKERLAVLERITVEKENSLAREIDQLRDR